MLVIDRGIQLGVYCTRYSELRVVHGYLGVPRLVLIFPPDCYRDGWGRGGGGATRYICCCL